MGMPTFRRGTPPEQHTHTLPPSQPRPDETPAVPGRTNRYAARCADCGFMVPENEGSLTSEGGKWVTRHFPDCETVNGDPEPKVVQAEVNIVNGKPLYDGIYTWETLTSHRTFRLRTQASDDDFMPGKQVIQHLTGPDNTYDYTSFGHITNGRLYVWKRHQDKATLVKDAREFFANPDQAEVAVSCFRCHRTLTVPASIHNGMGPECAGKGI